jgi:hypothetical protein
MCLNFVVTKQIIFKHFLWRRLGLFIQFWVMFKGVTLSTLCCYGDWLQFAKALIVSHDYCFKKVREGVLLWVFMWNNFLWKSRYENDSQAYNVNTCQKGKCNLSNSCEGFSLLKSLQTFSSFGGKHESKDGMGLNQPNIRLILNHFSMFTINLQIISLRYLYFWKTHNAIPKFMDLWRKDYETSHFKVLTMSTNLKELNSDFTRQESPMKWTFDIPRYFNNEPIFQSMLRSCLLQNCNQTCTYIHFNILLAVCFHCDGNNVIDAPMLIGISNLNHIGRDKMRAISDFQIHSFFHCANNFSF